MKKSILLSLFISFCSLAFANNMLVQNVSTTGNNAGAQTIQVQFDISWDNSWRDDINWDAAWIFMKFKDANGLWQHCKLNQTGFTNGSGTANTVQVTADKVGSWLYRSAQGAGTFNTTGIQLQWNYGLSGLTDVTGLEVRVFAVEMVYVPEGEFNCAKRYHIGGGYWGDEYPFNAPGWNFPVVNTRLSPAITTSITFRIKGDVGIDTNNDGIIDNETYPTGYRAFYAYKFELSEQQFADFFNTLTSIQQTELGIAGSEITINNGSYYSSSPNKACGNSSTIQLLSLADWSGLRPMSILEFNKLTYGPFKPIENGINAGIESVSLYTGSYRTGALGDVGLVYGKSFYGIMDVIGNAIEPVVQPNGFTFGIFNGDGLIAATGLSDIPSWNSITIDYIDNHGIRDYYASYNGFRYVRSAE